MTSGGKREGAGRKPGKPGKKTAPERVAVTVRITAEAAAKLNAFVAAKGTSQAREIEAWALKLRVP